MTDPQGSASYIELETVEIHHPPCGTGNPPFRCGDCVAAGRNEPCSRRRWTGQRPTLTSYVLAHHCTTCGAAAGQPCTAARKGSLHMVRQTAGARRYNRDINRAPWPEDRVTGARYDTLPRPETETR